MLKFISLLLIFFSMIQTINGESYESIKINSGKIINAKISRYIFGINLNSRENRFRSPVLMKYLKQWCEIIRWNSGGFTEIYDWYYNTLIGKPLPEKSDIFSVWKFFRTHLGKDIPMILSANTMVEVGKRNKRVKKILKPYNIERFSGVKHAAKFVQYCNKSVTRKMGKNLPHKNSLNIKFWEIGNEDNFIYNRILRLSRDEAWELYSKVFRRYALAMLKMDSNIKLMGPVSTQRFEDYMPIFLDENGDLVDIVAFHRYPKGLPEYRTMQGQLDYIDDYDEYFQTVWKMIDKYCVSTKRRKKKDIKIAITEYNAGHRTVCEPAKWEHALWVANIIGVFMKNNVYIANYWHGVMGTADGKYHHGLYDYKRGYKPFPAHYAFVFMHKYTHIREGSQLVYSQSTTDELASYAIKYKNGISLIVINKSPDKDIMTTIRLNDKKEYYGVTVNDLYGVGRTRKRKVKVKNGRLIWKFRSHSITAIEYKEKK